MAVLNIDVAASLDDGHIDGTSFYNTSTQMWMGGTPTAEHMWMLFTNVTIAKDATIDSAFVNLELVNVDSPTADITATWAAEDADDPIPFNGYDTGTMQWVNRTSTTATVNWTLEFGWAVGNKQTTDLKTIIQEIVNRAGWVSGQDILLWASSIAPNQEEWGFDSFDQSGGVLPELVITYTEGEQTSGILNGGGSMAATVTKHENQTLRPASTVTAASWDTAPTGGQSLDGYTSDESDATWIEDTTAV
jgi:hypothetical protein